MKLSCTNCNSGHFENLVLKNETILFEGIQLNLPSIKAKVCNSCSERAFGLKELRKLQKLKNEFVNKANALLSGVEITALRKKLGFSVSEFAELLGVTRQSVYGWEDESKDSKISPATLLVSMLNDKMELRNQILYFLISKAHLRGQLSKHELPKLKAAKPDQKTVRNKIRNISANFFAPQKNPAVGKC